MARDRSPLLDLPEAVLREVVSWSPDGETANTLLSTCRTAHQQRRDPATAALLLMRCPCQDYGAALASCWGCLGGSAAVVQQLLQLVAAGPESGGPFAAPGPLLQRALSLAALTGDAGTIRALLASPQPPDLNAVEGQAVRMSLRCRPPHEALQVLLESGADPCVGNFGLFTIAASKPDLTPALLLMLSHCPAAGRPAAIVSATENAIRAGNLAALEHLLRLLPAAPAATADADADPAIPAVGVRQVSWVAVAASAGHPEALQLVLDLTTFSQERLATSLLVAAFRGRAACVALLLDRGAGGVAGADAQHTLHMMFAVRQLPRRLADTLSSPAELREVVRLLLARGFVATPAVRGAAEASGHAAMLAAVAAEVAAAGGGA